MIALVIGIIIIAVGLIGSIWASNYDPGIIEGGREAAKYLAGDSSKFGIQEFFDSYGVILILIGIVFVGIGIWLMKKEQSSMRANYSAYDAMGLIEKYNKNATAEIKDGNVAEWIDDPETGEKLWTCRKCAYSKNKSSDSSCIYCRTKR